jgi:hypothetical protein
VSSVAGVICDRTQKARVPATPEVQSALANQSDACLARTNVIAPTSAALVRPIFRSV